MVCTWGPGGSPSIYTWGGTPLSIYMGGRGGTPLHAYMQYSKGYVPPLRGGECTQQNRYRYLVVSIGTDALTLHGHSQYM